MIFNHNTSIFFLLILLTFPALSFSKESTIQFQLTEAQEKPIDIKYETKYGEDNKNLDLSIPGQFNFSKLKNGSKINIERFSNAYNFLEKRLRQEDVAIPFVYNHLSPEKKAIITSVRNLSMVGLAVFAILWSLPEDFTHWDEDRELSNIFDTWRENVKKGPVVDQDNFFINYIGHPISGSFEYLFLRNQGFSKIESFGFAVFASTVIWEYGIESLAEVPSLQDLLLTPLIGSLLGETFYQWDKKLKLNDYKLLNSKRFGRIIHHLINPVEGINNIFDRAENLSFLHLDKIEFFVKKNNPNNYNPNDDNFVDEDFDLGNVFGIRFKVVF